MKWIDYFNGTTREICVYCDRREIKHGHMGPLGEAAKFGCLRVRERAENEIKQLIDEPCTMNDYEICPIRIAEEARMKKLTGGKQ